METTHNKIMFLEVTGSQIVMGFSDGTIDRHNMNSASTARAMAVRVIDVATNLEQVAANIWHDPSFDPEMFWPEED